MFGVSPKLGFTLAELLIALALLGIIAAFTIPKVLQSSAEQEKVAKLRETVATLESAVYDIKLTNPSSANNAVVEVATTLNAVAYKMRPDAGLSVSAPGSPYFGLVPAHPCNNAAYGATWIQFPNQVVVSGLGDYDIPMGRFQAPALDNSYFIAGVCIDVNGASPPNQAGQDVFVGNFFVLGRYDTVSDTFNYNKLFVWGSADTPLSQPTGIIAGSHSALLLSLAAWPYTPPVAPFDDPNTWVGTWLTR